MSIFHPLVWLLQQFKSLFNSMEKEFNKLEPSVQVAIKDATGIIQIISDNPETAPDEVLDIINSIYPYYDNKELHAALTDALHDANLIAGILDTSLIKTIANLQKYLASLDGLKWSTVIKNVRDLLAIALDPGATTWEKVALFGQWVYLRWFKK